MSLVLTLTYIFNVIIVVSLISGLLYVVKQLDDDNCKLRAENAKLKSETSGELMTLEELLAQFP
jgi:hypothetical protein